MAKRPAAAAGIDISGLEVGPKVRIALLTGKDLFAKQDLTRELREHAEKQHGEVDTVTFDGGSASAAEILDECRSFGLIAKHKIIIVDSAEDIVKEETRKLFENYAAEPCEGTTLILRGNGIIAGNLGKAIEKVGCVVACNPPTPQVALAWVKENAKPRHGVTIAPDAAELLVELVGPAMGQLDTEIAKLAAASGEANAITRELVANFVGRSREEDAWAIQGRILDTPPSKRLADLTHAIETLRIAPTLLLFSLTDLSKKLHATSRALKSGMPEQQVRVKAKLWGPSGDKLLATARATDWTRCLGLLRLCVEADKRSKSGLGDAQRSAELLSLRFPRAPR